MSQPEARLQRAIQAAIRKYGGFCFKVHGSEYMMAGLPDLIVCYRRRFIGLEVKMPEGKVSMRQRYVQEQIRSAGGICSIVTTVQDVIDILAAIDAVESSQTP